MNVYSVIKMWAFPGLAAVVLGCTVETDLGDLRIAQDREPLRMLGPDQAHALGLRSGPDSILEVWPDEGEPFRYVVFSGNSYKYGRGTFRVKYSLDLCCLLLTPTKGDDADDLLRPILQPAETEAARYDTRNSPFDYNYAGGGTLLQCPNGKLLYAYHGENQTDPTGVRHRFVTGWAGIGLAVWDEKHSVFRRDQQIIGVNQSNQWRVMNGELRTHQIASAAGQGVIFRNPADEFVYVLYADRSGAPGNPDPLSCGRTLVQCTAMARAKLDEVCTKAGTGRPIEFKKFYANSYSEPAVYRSGAPGDLGPGTGGRFTPLYPRPQGVTETSPSISYLEKEKLWVLAAVNQPANSIAVRFSRDLVRWSDQQIVRTVVDPANRMFYARLLILKRPGAARKLILTWMERQRDGWSRVALYGQDVSVATRSK